MTDATSVHDDAKACGRSRITNGKTVLDGVDGRSKAGRRFRDVLDQLIVEHDITTESDMLLARRAADLTAWLDDQASLRANGVASDVAASVTASNALRRILRDLAGSQRARRRSFRGTAA
jgi:hypothetical protein